MNEKYQMNRQLLRWWQQEKGDVSLVYIAGVMMLMSCSQVLQSMVARYL